MKSVFGVRWTNWALLVGSVVVQTVLLGIGLETAAYYIQDQLTGRRRLESEEWSYTHFVGALGEAGLFFMRG